MNITEPTTPATPELPQTVEKNTVPNALTFFLRHQPLRMILPAIAVLLPPLNLVLLRGWRLNIVRRMGTNQPIYLPDVSELGSLIRGGVVLWAMTGLFIIPHVALLGLFGFEGVQAFLQVIDWVYQRLILGQQPVDSFGKVMFGIVQAYGFALGIHAAYQTISWPTYRVGMMRYAITGDWRKFFDLRRNAKLGVMRYRSEFLEAFFVTLGVDTLLGLATTTFASVVVGVPLIPLLIVPLLYTANGYLWGCVTQRLRVDREIE